MISHAAGNSTKWPGQYCQLQKHPQAGCVPKIRTPPRRLQDGERWAGNEWGGSPPHDSQGLLGWERERKQKQSKKKIIRQPCPFVFGGSHVSAATVRPAISPIFFLLRCAEAPRRHTPELYFTLVYGRLRDLPQIKPGAACDRGRGICIPSSPFGLNYCGTHPYEIDLGVPAHAN